MVCMAFMASISFDVVTGGGTGTWEFVASTPGVTEIQPGSFVLMDAFYSTVRPEFGITQSILTTVISRRPGQYVLDIGSKGVSQDFAKTAVKNRPNDRAAKVAEEHTVVLTSDEFTPSIVSVPFGVIVVLFDAETVLITIQRWYPVAAGRLTVIAPEVESAPIMKSVVATA